MYACFHLSTTRINIPHLGYTQDLLQTSSHCIKQRGYVAFFKLDRVDINGMQSKKQASLAASISRSMARGSGTQDMEVT